MDVEKLVGKGLDKVFKILKPMTVPITLKMKSNEGFDFASGEPTADSDSDVVVKGIVVKTRHLLSGVVQKEVLMPSVEGLDAFDTMLILGQKWNIGAPIIDDGSLQVVEIFSG